MKPWEETWRLSEDTAGELDVYMDLDEEGACRRVLASDSANDDDTARARLAAAAPEMARLLLEAQSWLDDSSAYHGTSGGRDFDARLVAVLRKAGVLP